MDQEKKRTIEGDKEETKWPGIQAPVQRDSGQIILSSV